MAVMVLMIFATVGAFLAPGIPSPDWSLRGELSHLAVGASLALQDAQLAPAEIERLDATVADLDARLTDPGDLLGGGELDHTIGALAAARAALLEYDAANPGTLTDTLERLAQLSQRAIQAWLGRGNLNTLVFARPLDPAIAVSDEVLPIDRLPILITAGDIGTLQILGTAAGVEVGEIETGTGWYASIETRVGDDLVVPFERAGQVVMRVSLRGEFITIRVSDETPALVETRPASPLVAAALPVPALRTFPVRLAGFVIVEQQADAIELVSVAPENGWHVDTTPMAGAVLVNFRREQTEISFRAQLLDGVVYTEVREQDIAPAGTSSDEPASWQAEGASTGGSGSEPDPLDGPAGAAPLEDPITPPAAPTPAPADPAPLPPPSPTPPPGRPSAAAAAQPHATPGRPSAAAARPHAAPGRPTAAARFAAATGRSPAARGRSHAAGPFLAGRRGQGRAAKRSGPAGAEARTEG